MIQVCKKFEDMMEEAWNKFQREIVENTKGISQLDCDDECARIVAIALWSKARKLQTKRILREHGIEPINIMTMKIVSHTDLCDGEYDLEEKDRMSDKEFEEAVLREYDRLIKGQRRNRNAGD